MRRVLCESGDTEDTLEDPGTLHPAQQEGKDVYAVVYIGMARGPKSGMRERLSSHARGTKKDEWTHFSIFEVWDNIREEEVEELEGLLRHPSKRCQSQSPERTAAFKKLTMGKKKLQEWHVKES